jgi:biotin transport system substrate-specific component
MRFIATALTLPRASSIGRTLAMATIGALSLALLAQVRIPVPGTPVPGTLQVLGVLLLGAVLGPRVAVLATMEYLFLGAAGLPVYNCGGAGLGYLFGITGGYLLAMPFAAALYGPVFSRVMRRPGMDRLAAAVTAGVVCMAIIYLGGWLWWVLPLHTKPGVAFLAAVTPFIGFDVLKVLVVAWVVALRR